ncbi:MAG: hypothetical protein APR62_03505 [Smithella sp. SDB]|nr:MAG: hypothetical protein APR62_03505 [Smithella sp. SDB]
MNEKNRSDISNMRRSQLTKAAYKIVSKKGYHNLTIKDISRETGLSAGLVHYYFKDKKDLQLNLIRETNANIKEMLVSELIKTDDPVAKIRTYLDQAFGLVEKEKEYFHVIIDFWSQVNRNNRMKQANIKLFQSYRDECVAILKEGIQKGVFKEMDVNYMSILILSLVEGTMIQHFVDENAFNYGEYSEKMRNQIMDIILKK